MENIFNRRKIKVRILKTNQTLVFNDIPLHNNIVKEKKKDGAFDINLKEQFATKKAVLFGEDTVQIFKEKIYVESGILPFKQHVRGVLDDTTIPILYEILVGKEPVDISITSNENNLVPDVALFQNKDLLVINNFEFETLMESLPYKEYVVYNLDDYIDQVKGKDEFEISMFYYTFVLKYFPYLSLEAFKKYLNDDIKTLEAEYTTLFAAEKRGSLEDELLTNMYDLLHKNDPEVKKLYPEYLINKDPSSSLCVSIKITNLSLEVRPQVFDAKDKINIDLTQLFINLHILDGIALIKLNGEQPLIKLSNIDIVRYYNVYEKYINKAPLSIIYKLEKREKENYLPYLLLLVNQNGSYNVLISLNKSNIILTSIIKNLQADINPLIEKINSLNRSVFTTIRRLPLLQPDNYKFKNLDIQILWFKNVSLSEFGMIKTYLDKDIESGLISIRKEELSRLKILYNKIPLFRNYNIQNNEILQASSNEFEYYTNSGIYEAVNKEWSLQKLIIIEHIGNHITFKISTQNLNNFKYFYKYLISLMYHIRKFVKVVVTTQKSLKHQDPVLYNLKKYGSNKVYSRLCQKKHQPRIINASDASANDISRKAVKFWNFTTQKPEYYYCPNKIYPHLNFITGQHPEGFCLPCCQKMSQNVGNKKGIYDICLKDYQFKDKLLSETQRHISKYGKIIMENRLSYLPPQLKLFIDNTINKNLLFTIKNKKVFIDNKEYALTLIKKIVKYSKVRTISVDMLRGELIRKNVTDSGISLQDILDNQKKYHIDLSKIKNTNLDKPIIVYKNDEKYSIVDGIYVLGNAILNGKKELLVKYILKKQLEKLGGDELDVPNYYIYGVPQSAANIANCGVYHLLLSTFNLKPEGLLQKIASVIEDKKVFYSLLQNKMRFYFPNTEEFMRAMGAAFLNQDIFLLNFEYWNEILIELVEHMFAIKPIIIEHNFKTHKLTITDFGSTYKDFILIIKIIDKNDIANMPDIVFYYPIYFVVLKNFYKNQAIEQKVFNMGDPIIKSLIKLLKVIVVDQKYSIKTFEEFQRPDIYYLNLKNLCYAVGYNLGKEHIVLPVDYSNVYGDNISYEAKNMSNISIRNWKKIVYNINLFIVKKSELLGLVRNTIEDKDLAVREQNVISRVKLLKMTTVLVYNQNVIGCANEDFSYYFLPTSLDSVATKDTERGGRTGYNDKHVRKVINYLQSGYSVFSKEPAIRVLLYHPDEVNMNIKSFVEKGATPFKYSKKINEILYKKRLYFLFTSTIMSYLDGEYDEQKHAALKDSLNSSLDVIERDERDENNDDIEKLSKIRDKKLNPDDFIFDFDKVVNSKLAKVTKKTEMLEILNPVLKKVLIEEPPKFSEEPCYSLLDPSIERKSGFKEGEKLMIKKSDLKEMLDLFYDDLMNPLKRDYLLNSALVAPYYFAKNLNTLPNEIIFAQIHGQ